MSTVWYNKIVKKSISKLFLYRHRFIIGYIVLGIAFVALLLIMPLFANNGLSDAEMDSAANSYYLNIKSVTNGDLVNLPYRALQKLSIGLLGLSVYSVKLPSIIIGLLLGFLLILLLNRWFKNNVSLLASCLIVLSTPFLYLAGTGTPLIMIVFWPTLLLWLGSKIHGEKRPKPLYSLAFALALLLAIFTPYMIYFAIFCIFFVFLQPHLRFIIKSLPKIPLIITCILIVSGITALIINTFSHPSTIMELLFAKDFHLGNFWNNLVAGVTPMVSWRGNPNSPILAPLIGLPTFAIALIGIFSTTKGFFASRNSIATLLLIFTVIITGFNSDSIIFFILPFTILIAHGLKYILEKWYGLFPSNPYARISAILPLTVLFALILIPSTLQYLYGYHYNPNITDTFNNNLTIIKDNLKDEILVTKSHQDFYQILDRSTKISVTNEISENFEHFAYLGKPESVPAKFQLTRIITSAKSDNSDIIYLYTAKGE